MSVVQNSSLSLHKSNFSVYFKQVKILDFDAYLKFVCTQYRALLLYIPSILIYIYIYIK
jgi:hypothetical protein